jgi:Uri superfamily endonuclease
MKGTYALMLHLPSNQTFQVGRLGTYGFDSGFYIYVGSAFGPGGLAARLKHHLRKTDRPHWHIDCLRYRSVLKEIWFSKSEERGEHLWASVINKMTGAFIPVKNFGSTDCRCPSHLFFFLESPRVRVFKQMIPKDGFTGNVDRCIEFSSLLLHEGIDKRT